MKIQYVKDNKQLTAGTTLKDTKAFENGNLALHATQNPKQLIENRQQFATKIGIPHTHLTLASQTHSDHIHKVTKADQGRGATTTSTAIPDTDALYTTETDILLGTLTADCVPIVFHDKANQLIGVAHSGWKGTVKEIIRKVFIYIQKKEQIHPKNLHVYLGPAISQEKFEVDTDVYDQYKQLGYANDFIYYNHATNKYHIDNQKVVARQCRMSGVPNHQITCDRTCTFLSRDHFSYRENKHNGHHLSFIVMKKP